MTLTPIMQAVKAFEEIEEIDTLMLGTHHPASGRVMAEVRRGIAALAPFINHEKTPVDAGA